MDQTTTDKQKKDLCRKVWCVYGIKQNPKFETITKDVLENCENSYNVEPVEPLNDNLIYKVDTIIGDNEVVKNVPAIGCQLKRKNKKEAKVFYVFVSVNPIYRDSFYLIIYDDKHGVFFLIDLIENIDLSQNVEKQVPISEYSDIILKPYWEGKKND